VNETDQTINQQRHWHFSDPRALLLTPWLLRIKVYAMKFSKVQFTSEQDAARALHGLMQRGRVTGLRDGTFLIPAPALEWLTEHGIPHRVLQTLNQDDVLQAIRDNLASPV